MEIIALKLVTGEEILGEVPPLNEFNSDTMIRLVNPVGISVVRGPDGGPSVGFSPFPLHAEQKKNSTIDIRMSNVVYSYVPAEDFISNYEEIFGSGIIMPNKKLITG
jgi:hypothetical protein